MTRDAVYSTLHSQSFKPFALDPVPHPEYMVVSQGERTAIVNTEGQKFSIVDLGLVTAIEIGGANGN